MSGWERESQLVVASAARPNQPTVVTPTSVAIAMTAKARARPLIQTSSSTRRPIFRSTAST